MEAPQFRVKFLSSYTLQRTEYTLLLLIYEHSFLRVDVVRAMEVVKSFEMFMQSRKVQLHYPGTV